MGISYPASVDTFPVPALPETTSLSSAGSANRAHTDHHRDLGAGLTAVMTNAALKTHAHTGADGTGKLLQANTHEGADTDTSLAAVHHSLGTAAFQAAAGNHVHDYNGPTIVGKPYQLCTSTTRPGAPYRGLQIYETDTDQVRVWGSFLNNDTITGIDSTDTYTGAAGPPSTVDWTAIVYEQGDTTHGLMQLDGSGNLQWVDNSGFNNSARMRRKKVADAKTLGDDQVITWKTGTTVIEDILLFTAGASNDKFFRVSDDFQSYLRLVQGTYGTSLYYSNYGVAGEVLIGSLPGVNSAYANTEWAAILKDRSLALYRAGEFMGTIVDTNKVSAKGPSNRGWGVGMGAGQRGFGQTTPANEQWVRIQDLNVYDSINRWTILPVAKFPIVRLRQSANQSLAANGSIMEWSQVVEDGFTYFNPSVKTDIVVKEPGLYQIDAAVQWDARTVPDIAYVILCVNGLETTIRKQQFMRGNGFTPGFSQTVDLSGKLRFSPNDVLTVKVKYANSSGSIFDFILSFFEGSSNVNSRIDVAYMGV